MARRTQTVTIAAEGRDKGKTFVLTEMASDAAERWAIRALLAVTNTGVDLPDGVLDAGMAGLASVGIRALAKLPYEAAAPLLADMFACVKYQHKEGAPLQPIFEGDACQIEEVATRLTLRTAVLELHTGFSLGGAP